MRLQLFADMKGSDLQIIESLCLELLEGGALFMLYSCTRSNGAPLR